MNGPFALSLSNHDGSIQDASMNREITKDPAKKPLFYGWIVVGASSIVTLSAATSAISLLSLFVVPLSDEFGWSRSVIAGGISGGTLVGVLGAVFVGRIVDKHGARKLLASGCFAQGIATIGLAFTQGLWMLLPLLAIARSNLVAVVSVAAPTAAGNWFIRKRSQAMAWVVMGDKTSLIIFPPLVQAIISAGNWRVAWASLGVFTLVFGVIPALAFIRRRPEDMGLLPDGDEAAPTTEASPELEAVQETQWTSKEAMHTPALWMLVVLQFVRGAVGTSIAVHRVPYFTDQGIDATIAATLVTVFAFGMGVGTPLWTKLMDIVPSSWALALHFLAMGFVMAFLLIVSSPGVAYVYAFTEGVIATGNNPVILITIARYYGRQSLGTIRGMTQVAWIAGLAIGPPVAGLAYDVRGSYAIAFAFFGALAVLASLLAIRVKPPEHPEGAAVAT